MQIMGYAVSPEVVLSYVPFFKTDCVKGKSWKQIIVDISSIYLPFVNFNEKSWTQLGVEVAIVFQISIIAIRIFDGLGVFLLRCVILAGLYVGRGYIGDIEKITNRMEVLQREQTAHLEQLHQEQSARIEQLRTEQRSQIAVLQETCANLAQDVRSVGMQELRSLIQRFNEHGVSIEFPEEFMEGVALLTNFRTEFGNILTKGEEVIIAVSRCFQHVSQKMDSFAIGQERLAQQIGGLAAGQAAFLNAAAATSPSPLALESGQQPPALPAAEGGAAAILDISGLATRNPTPPHTAVTIPRN